MSDLLRYLTEEIATDHADGLLTRREALRQLALLGVSATAAATLLTACEKHQATNSPPPAQTTTGASATPSAATSASAPANAASAPAAPAPGAPGAPTEAITFKGPEGRTLQGSWSGASKPRGGVLVL